MEFTEAEMRFLTVFAQHYDLRQAAAAAKMKRSEGYALLLRDEACEQVDRLAQRRRLGERTARIVTEYESIAFGGDEGKAADRIRALEALRSLQGADDGEAGAAAPVIEYGYV